MTVPLSSSEMNVRERPDMAEKKMMIQKTPERISGDGVSFPMAKRMIAMVVMTNIRSALSAYRVLSSERRSFAKIEVAPENSAQGPAERSERGVMLLRENRGSKAGRN